MVRARIRAGTRARARVRAKVRTLAMGEDFRGGENILEVKIC